MTAAHLKGPEVYTARHAGCTGKAGFQSRADAKRMADRFKGHKPPYQCPFCRLWHNSKRGRVKPEEYMKAALHQT